MGFALKKSNLTGASSNTSGIIAQSSQICRNSKSMNKRSLIVMASAQFKEKKKEV